MIVVESVFEAEWVGIRREGRGCHLAEPGSGWGMKRRKPGQFADPFPGVSDERMASLAHFIPMIVLLESDRGWYG